MSAQPRLLVLHGITMNGASMLRTLGPLGARLQALGFSLVAPNAAHRLEEAELSGLMAWMAKQYRDAGQSESDWFVEGEFWSGGEHYDWFQSTTDKASGKKTYQALEASLERVAEAVREHPAVGVIGFSQGAAMAMIVAALATLGDPRFRGLRCGVFLSGFKPVFDAPRLFDFPAGSLPRLFAIGERDAIFPGNAGYLGSLSQAFAGGEAELLVVPGLAHQVPNSPEQVERIAELVRRSVDAN